MCGIVGVAGDITQKLEKTFKTLLILDSLRGIDSTGMAAVHRHQAEVSIAKQIGNPYELFDYPPYARALNKQNRVLIGHNRYATQGGVNRANAHPFDFDTLVGVHNGTLQNKHKLDDSADYKVDSQNLYHHINKNGLKHAINLCEGAWSLVWWDKIEETLNFLRNKERPMFIATTKNKKALVWASEDWMIEVACAREEVELEEIYSTNVDQHFSYFIPKTYDDIDLPITTEVRGASGTVVTNHHFNWHEHLKQQEEQRKAAQAAHQAGKVVSFHRATTKTDQGTQIASGGALYSGTKGVCLDVLSEQRDEDGARYLVCFDENVPQTNIRLYLKKEDKAEKLVGQDIIADIGKYHMKKGGRGFYKVDYSTFRLAKPVRIRESEETEQEGSSDDSLGDEKYLGRHGVFLTKDNWEQENGECDWCGGSIFAGEAHKFVMNRESVLCKTCIEDEEVSKYLN